jgi:hypothetical protein
MHKGAAASEVQSESRRVSKPMLTGRALRGELDLAAPFTQPVSAYVRWSEARSDAKQAIGRSLQALATRRRGRVHPRDFAGVERPGISAR